MSKIVKVFKKQGPSGNAVDNSIMQFRESDLAIQTAWSIKLINALATAGTPEKRKRIFSNWNEYLSTFRPETATYSYKEIPYDGSPCTAAQ